LGTHCLSPLPVVYQWTPTGRTPSHDLEKNGEAAFKAKSLATAKVKAGEGGGEGARVCPCAG